MYHVFSCAQLYCAGHSAIQTPLNMLARKAVSKCHPDQFNDWKVSGHPYKIQKAEIAKTWMLPLPKGYSWDDISYVIGGAHKKSRYMDKKGYIITMTGPNKDVPGKTSTILRQAHGPIIIPAKRIRNMTAANATLQDIKKKGIRTGLKA